MRSTRLLSLLGLALLPSLAAAQEKNPFVDSWFWGAKGGLTALHTSVARTTAPVIGAEWLVTRSWYGLYLGLDQAYFDAVSTVANAPTNGVVRRVDIRDMRRLTIAMDLFPRVFLNSIRPYFGLGYAINLVVNAVPSGTNSPAGVTFASAAERDTVLSRINDAKARQSLIGTFGIQADWHRFAPFVQASVMPTKGQGQFLINGDGFSYYVEGGLRINFGSSIEKLK